MADEMERNSPQSPSVATPPQIDDSPEMVNQPSSPEEGISSSTDQWIPETPASPDSPDEPRVSSTSELEQNAGERSPTLSDSDASQEVENQSQPDGPPDHVIRHMLESPPALPRPTRSVRSPVQNAVLQTGLVGAAVVVPAVPVPLESPEIVSVVIADEEESSQEITEETIKQNMEISDDSNQQFDMDDSSSAPKTSPENVHLGSDSSPSGSDVYEDESKASGSAIMETSGLQSNSASRMDIVKENICSETDITKTVGLESQSSQKTSSDMEVSGSDATEKMKLSKDSPMEADSGIQVSGRDTTEKMELSEDSAMKTDSGLQVSGPKKTIGLADELSPSKTSSDIKISVTGTTESTGIQGPSPSKSVATESNTPERRRGTFSPKRKSPTKLQHSSPKKSCQSPDKKQSDSQMSTLLEELDIQETENNTESAEPASEQEQEMSSERIETDETQNENEDEMEVQETDFQTKSEKNDDMFKK